MASRLLERRARVRDLIVSFKNSSRDPFSELVSPSDVGPRKNRPHNCLLHSVPIQILRSGKNVMDIANVVAALMEQRTRIDGAKDEISQPKREMKGTRRLRV